MNYKIFIIIALVASVLLSGCVYKSRSNMPSNLPSDLQPAALKDIKPVGSINGIELYQMRIDSINATCVYGSNNHLNDRVDVFDCKYD